MTYAAELDEKRAEVRAASAQAVVFWPKVTGIGNVEVSAASYGVAKPDGTALGGGSATITDVDGVSRVAAIFDASALALGENYRVDFAWTSDSVDYSTAVRFDVVREPYDGSDVSLNDLRDEMGDIGEALEALARAKDTERTAEQEASVVAVRACSEVKGWIRGRLASQGRIYPRLLLDRESLRRVVSAQAISRIYQATGGGLTSPARQLALDWTMIAKARLAELGDGDYDADEDGVADGKVGGLTSVRLRRGGYRDARVSPTGSGGASSITPSAASGDVVGPASAVDNALARYDGVTGKLIQGSLVTVSDGGSIALPALQTVDGVDVSDLEGRVTALEGVSGTGDVVGPASATDNAIARYDTTTGKLIQSSVVTVDDSGNIATSGTVDGVDVSGIPGTVTTVAANLAAHAAAIAPHTGHIASAVLTTNGDLLVRSGGGPARLGIGTTGQVPRVIGGALVFAYPMDPRRETHLVEDFIRATAGTGFTFANFSLTSSNTTADRTGIVQYNSTATGQGSVSTGTSHLVLGTETFVEWSILMPALSDGTDAYTVYVGTGDNTAAGDHADSIGFRYTHSVNSGNWQGVCRSNSVETGSVVNGSVAATGSAWVRLGFYLNAALNQVEFFVDGVSIGTTGNNIPTASARALGLMLKVDRTAGTTSRVFAADYVQLWKAVSR